MSVIVALISTRDGVVASDGRRFGSARIENGRVVQPASVESEEFDKTFSLHGGRIVGAFAGLMSFSGRTIAEHISEVVSDALNSSIGFHAVLRKTREDMTMRLEQVGDQEVGLPFRKLDVTCPPRTSPVIMLVW